jgi:hypothetical protein
LERGYAEVAAVRSGVGLWVASEYIPDIVERAERHLSESEPDPNASL